MFGRTKHGVRKLNRDLQRLGHRSVELQGNMSQTARERVMTGFRQAQSRVLVATNVAAVRKCASGSSSSATSGARSVDGSPAWPNAGVDNEMARVSASAVSASTQ